MTTKFHPTTSIQSPPFFDFLFRPVDIASLVFFRIIFGILAFADVLGIWIYYHLYEGFFQPENFQFYYYGFEWVTPFPEPLLSLFFIALMIAAICIALGRWYRVCTVIFAFGFTYLFLLEKVNYLNHGYLFCWLSFTMIFLPANRAFSGDVLKMPRIRLEKIPYWSLFILQFFIGLVYFYGGLAKLNMDWLNALPLKIWLKYDANMPLLGWLWNLEATAWIMSYGGLLFDLSVVFLLLNRRTRILALILAILFHTVNTILFQIGIFPTLSLAMTLLYFPPDLPRRWLVFLKPKWAFLKKWETKWQQNLQSKEATLAKPTSLFVEIFPRKRVLFFLISLCCFHLLYPFRHHLLEGEVAWTEEGHRYSWRMMLRAKQGYGVFRIKNLDTGEIETVKMDQYLHKKQRRKVLTHPDMILQFAHFLKEEWAAKGVENIAVFADIKCNLNGRSYQQYVDPKVDLAKEEWSFLKESTWVLPLK